MSEMKESFEEIILKIKTEFINAIKRDLEIGSDGTVDEKGIRASVYKFIFDKVVGKDMVGVKEGRKLFLDLFVDTVDFCLNFGDVIIEILSDIQRLKDYKRFVMIKKDEEVIDA